MSTVVDCGAVQVHQTEPLPYGFGGQWIVPLVSAASMVAPTRVPVKVTEEPESGVAFAKLSLGGGVCAMAEAVETSRAAIKQ